MAQKRFRFDRETLIKIGKGSLFALSSPIALQIANWAGHSNIPLWARILVWGVPTGVNVIKEFIRGEKNGEARKKIKES